MLQHVHFIIFAFIISINMAASLFNYNQKTNILSLTNAAKFTDCLEDHLRPVQTNGDELTDTWDAALCRKKFGISNNSDCPSVGSKVFYCKYSMYASWIAKSNGKAGQKMNGFCCKTILSDASEKIACPIGFKLALPPIGYSCEIPSQSENDPCQMVDPKARCKPPGNCEISGQRYRKTKDGMSVEKVKNKVPEKYHFTGYCCLTTDDPMAPGQASSDCSSKTSAIEFGFQEIVKRPDDWEKPKAELGVNFELVEAKLGKLLFRNQTSKAPKITLPKGEDAADKFYLIAVLDDTPHRHTIHNFVCNRRFVGTDDATVRRTIFDYAGPWPPFGDTAHTYSILAFRQTKELSEDECKGRIGAVPLANSPLVYGRLKDGDTLIGGQFFHVEFDAYGFERDILTSGLDEQKDSRGRDVYIQLPSKPMKVQKEFLFQLHFGATTISKGGTPISAAVAAVLPTIELVDGLTTDTAKKYTVAMFQHDPMLVDDDDKQLKAAIWLVSNIPGTGVAALDIKTGTANKNLDTIAPNGDGYAQPADGKSVQAVLLYEQKGDVNTDDDEDWNELIPEDGGGDPRSLNFKKLIRETEAIDPPIAGMWFTRN